MQLYSQASWLPVHSSNEQTGYYTLPYSAHVIASTAVADGPEFLQQSKLFTGIFLVAFTTFLSRIVVNWNAPKYLPRQADTLVAFKIFFGVVYIAGAIAMLVHDSSEWILLSAGAATAIAFAVVSVSEHYHSIGPSTVTSLYAIYGTAFYGYTLRGLQEIQAPQVYLCATGAAAVSLVALIFFESKSKRSLLIPMDPPPAYESTLSLFVKPFFPHLIPLLFTGSHRRITLPDLCDIPLYLRSDPATEMLLAALAVEDKNSDRYLVKSTFRAFRGHFFSPVLPRLVVLAGTFAQVTLVEQMILYVSDKSIPKERGATLVVAYFVVYVSLAIATYVYYEKVNAFIVLYRSALTGSLYAKTLRLRYKAARELGQGAATTYMSVDVEKITSGFQLLQDFWANMVTILIACTMLWFKAGYVMFAPLLVIIALISTTSKISRFVGAAQNAWLTATDARIRLLTSVLGQLLPIKLGAYEVALEGKINALRKLETEAFGRFLYLLMSLSRTIASTGGTASFFVTLAAYAFMLARGWGDLAPLDVSQIFTLFTIVNLLSGPLSMIGQYMPQLFAAYASLVRIQGFLQLPEKAETERDSALDSGNLIDVTDGGAKRSSVEVSLRGCTFTWDDKVHVLKDITLALAPGALHVVVGSVASGKSSLLMSILGETTLLAGTLTVKARKIALASQTPFIYPETLRANILLDNPYNEALYDQVIHACGLRQDIEALPRRDMTKLGDKGTTLSGGQRQRLAIARAVYARADLVLLDDVFSALDGETEAHVFESLFGSEGMLQGKTTVLVTHGVHHLPSADKVIVMDIGKIAHFGSFEEVRDAGATFALTSAGELAAKNGQVVAMEAATAPTVVDEEKDEELNWTREQASRRSSYAFYMKCTGVLRACGLLLLITIWSGTQIFAMVYLSMLASSGDHLGRWVAGYGAIVASTLVSMALTMTYFSYILSSFAAPHVHGAELAGVMRSPISWITKTPAGNILNRFSQDMYAADRDFPFAFINYCTSILGMTGTFVFIAMATPLLTFVLPVLAVGGAYFLRFYLATSKQFRRLELGSKSPLYTLFGTTVSGLITVRAYSAQAFFRAQNAAFVNESQGALHHRVTGQLFLRVFLLWFQTILACSIAVLTVWLRDSTSATFLGIALSRLVSLGPILHNVLESLAVVENGSVAIDRIQEFAELPPEEKVVSNEMPMNDPSTWPSVGSLTFADFSMKYRGDLPLALKNLSFDLQGGLKVGICGRTGSGKSSTVLALFRGIDQHLVTGKIAIDGVDIATMPLNQLRESMGIVTQDPFLWHGSIRENLDVRNERTDSEIWETLKLVEMYDAVSALDDKIDHLVVDEESFSKGQRQLLCLARALLGKKKIIVLDESTSSMDHITNEKICHVVDTQMQGLTVLAIAHRISTIVNYDKILVLENGTIAEFDAPAVLLANPESRFARLAATQGIYHPDLVPNGAAVKELGEGTVVVVTEDLVDL
ncbi:P-loop containing nucleoside triphosphate hydrolase protein [Mycena rosella]|uniref:P-loop containing nucleoside triphosphate hydrolase protein n=1 Tax=Mycena rosella TaxID=1033263 RepID=A0AAD7MC80_MYCRO|nr:P-loop containing nucleoside triphosphate hydrolase protein [Mycena rosella]